MGNIRKKYFLGNESSPNILLHVLHESSTQPHNLFCERVPTGRNFLPYSKKYVKSSRVSTPQATHSCLKFGTSPSTSFRRVITIPQAERESVSHCSQNLWCRATNYLFLCLFSGLPRSTTCSSQDKLLHISRGTCQLFISISKQAVVIQISI